MAKVLTTEERFSKARVWMKKAGEIPAPAEAGWETLNYAASVKDTLRQARDLLKFLPQTAGVTPEQKKEALDLMQKIVETEKVILHKH